jgi:hypothetical protein
VSLVRRLAAALLVALLATGCGAIDALLDTEQALEDAGFRNPSLDWYSENGVERLVVSWRASAETEEALTEESLQAAGVLWRKAPIYFDVAETDPSVLFATDAFSTRRTFARTDLERAFGPRPEGLDQSAADLFNVRGILIGVAAVVTLGLALIVLIIVLLVRSGRRRRAAAAYGYYGSWGPPPPRWPPPASPDDPWRAPPG